MSISERMLRKWRKEALSIDTTSEIAMHEGNEVIIRRIRRIVELTDRVLRMTAELLDQHLLRKK